MVDAPPKSYLKYKLLKSTKIINCETSFFGVIRDENSENAQRGPICILTIKATPDRVWQKIHFASKNLVFGEESS